MSDLVEPLEELKIVDEEKALHPVEEEFQVMEKEPVEELKPMDDKQNAFHSLVEEECPVSKEEFKCDQKLPFIFEWVEVSSDIPLESVTGAEYPVVEEECPVTKEELKCDQEPLSTPEMEEERLASPPESVTQATKPDPIEYYTFSLTNPRFDMLMAYSHLKPRYHAILPLQITRKLPEEKVSVVLNSYGKKWTMSYNGHLMSKTLARGWKAFAVENELKIGDCCFFELTEKSKGRVEFKVVIMKTEPHSEAEGVGGTLEEPILIE